MKLAAIDIGTNAARLLISEVVHDEQQKPQFNKLSLVRVPLRLGFDVFETGEISKKKAGMLYQTMKAYCHLLYVYEVDHFKACATSAMRDASNAEEIVRKVKMETGIEIKVITGDEEATYIYQNHIAEQLNAEHAYLYIDVGGGSTELTFFKDGVLNFRQSFNVGTIRLLKQTVLDEDWESMKTAIRNHIKSKLPIVAIGSGGNINKIFSLSKKKEGKALHIDLLKDYYKELSSVSLEQRVLMYKLRQDRADVIVPALQIYTTIMRWAEIDEIYVPKIGLADGLIQSLYEELSVKSIT